MGVFIGGIIAGVVIIFLGVILAKSKNSKLWHILSVIGTGVTEKIMNRLPSSTPTGESRKPIRRIIN